ncbi:hypothetical protein N8334_04215 [Flavobacteriaceae bacterium]|nr:hypothetical protein [Flavobacteriaceae bacterium]
MALKKTELLNIFNLIPFDLLELKGIGTVIKMEAYSAFDFSAITGANYLVEPIGVTMKGRNETFIHRAVFQEGSYIYSPGLFERNINRSLSEGNSADKLLRLYPDVFSGDKYILINEISTGSNSNIDINVYNEIEKHGFNPKNFVLYKLFESGQSQESIYEYFTSLFYIKKGYIVENQTPWFQQNYLYKGERLNGGIPDFSAFKTDIINPLREFSILSSNEGILINKIPVIKNFITIKKKTDFTVSKVNYDLIIGEVKSDNSSIDQAIRQMNKYSNVELANKIYSIIPNCKNNGSENFGEFYLDQNILKINESEKSLMVNSVSQQIDRDWINVNVKLNLLGNANFNLLMQYLINKYGLTKDEIKSFHLIDFAMNISIPELIKII